MDPLEHTVSVGRYPTTQREGPFGLGRRAPLVYAEAISALLAVLSCGAGAWLRARSARAHILG